MYKKIKVKFLKVVFTIFWFNIIFPLIGQNSDTVKVMFIGHSAINYYYSMPEMVQNLANAAGKNAIIVDASEPGTDLEYHIEFALNRIYQYKWDYVLLADYFISDSSFLHNKHIPALNIYDSLLHENYECTELIFYYMNAYYEVNESIKAYKEIADKYNAILAIPELAAYYYKLENPDVVLTGDDGGHGNETRIYLKACAMYSTIFKESANGINYYANLDIDSAIYIQQFASDLVLNDLVRWNLELKAQFDPVITNNAVSFENITSNAYEYLWDFGDGKLSNSKSPVHAYEKEGNYTINLSVNRRCNKESDNYSESVEIQKIENEIKIYPNPTKDIITIENKRFWPEVEVTIYDLNGKKVFTETHFTNSNQIELNLLNLPNNNYIISLSSSGNAIEKKIIKF